MRREQDRNVTGQDRNVTDQVRNDKRGKSAMLRIESAMRREQDRNDKRGKSAMLRIESAMTRGASPQIQLVEATITCRFNCELV